MEELAEVTAQRVCGTCPQLLLDTGRSPPGVESRDSTANVRGCTCCCLVARGPAWPSPLPRLLWEDSWVALSSPGCCCDDPEDAFRRLEVSQSNW